MAKGMSRYVSNTYPAGHTLFKGIPKRKENERGLDSRKSS